MYRHLIKDSLSKDKGIISACALNRNLFARFKIKQHNCWVGIM